jgi:hypothetical protein
MTSAQFNNPDKSLSETLTLTARSIQGEHINLRQLLELIGEQSLLILCMFLTIPFLLPVSIPGVSTVFGLVITLIGVGVMLNRVPWLPRPLMNRPIASAHLVPAIEKASHFFARLERWVRPRLLVLTHGATINRFNGFVVVMAGILLMAPLGLIPFSNTLPALAILLLAAGMAQRDGLFILGGYLLSLLTVAYFSFLALTAVMAGHGLKSLLSVISVLG